MRYLIYVAILSLLAVPAGLPSAAATHECMGSPLTGPAGVGIGVPSETGQRDYFEIELQGGETFFAAGAAVADAPSAAHLEMHSTACHNPYEVGHTISFTAPEDGTYMLLVVGDPGTIHPFVYAIG